MTSPFPVDSQTQAVTVNIGFLTTSGSSTVAITAYSGPSYATATSLGSQTCSACNRWETRTIDVSAFRGQSITLKFQRSSGTVGIDSPREAILFPDYTTSGLISRVTEADGNDYAKLETAGC